MHWLCKITKTALNIAHAKTTGGDIDHLRAFGAILDYVASAAALRQLHHQRLLRAVADLQLGCATELIGFDGDLITAYGQLGD